MAYGFVKLVAADGIIHSFHLSSMTLKYGCERISRCLLVWFAMLFCMKGHIYYNFLYYYQFNQCHVKMQYISLAFVGLSLESCSRWIQAN